MYWNEWSLERILVLFVSLAFLMMAIQVTMYHYRQNFHHKAMWSPVISAPLYFIVGTLFSLFGTEWLHKAFIILMWMGILTGMIGSFLHVRGVGLRVGGYAWRNFLIGPPIMLPMMYTALSALGLLAAYWK